MSRENFYTTLTSSSAETPVLADSQAFAGRTVLITGGTGKIGLELSRVLLASGAEVVVSDIRADTVEQRIAEFKASGYEKKVLGLVLSAVEGPKIVEQTLAKFGKIDVILQPIVAPFQFKSFEDMPDEEFENTFKTDVIGPISVLKAAWPHMKKQKYGRVVNFTSGAIFGMKGASTYPTTKGALLGINKTLAQEGADYNITVNCISPIGLYKEPQQAGVSKIISEANAEFLDACSPVSNVPPILALAHEKNVASGELFYTGAWGCFRHSMGLTPGATKLDSVEKALAFIPSTLKKGKIEITEVLSSTVLGQYQAMYYLGKEGEYVAPTE